jgi:hypothetical protein
MTPERTKEIEAEAYSWDKNAFEETFIMPVRLARFAKHIATKYEAEYEQYHKAAQNDIAKLYADLTAKDQEINSFKQINEDQASIIRKRNNDLAELQAQLTAYKEVSAKMAEVLEALNRPINGADDFTKQMNACSSVLTAYHQLNKEKVSNPKPLLEGENNK